MTFVSFGYDIQNIKHQLKDFAENIRQNIDNYSNKLYLCE